MNELMLDNDPSKNRFFFQALLGEPLQGCAVAINSKHTPYTHIVHIVSRRFYGMLTHCRYELLLQIMLDMLDPSIVESLFQTYTFVLFSPGEIHAKMEIADHSDSILKPSEVIDIHTTLNVCETEYLRAIIKFINSEMTSHVPSSGRQEYYFNFKALEDLPHNIQEVKSEKVMAALEKNVKDAGWRFVPGNMTAGDFASFTISPAPRQPVDQRDM